MIPDYCEAITAYRCWNVFPNGLLVGQAHAEPWPPFQPFVGRCGMARSADHIREGQWVAAPVWGCDCGVHALKRADAAERRLIEEILNQRHLFTFSFRLDNYSPPAGRVWGAVKLWGRLIEHEVGYRAEFAYPAALYCQDERLARMVSALYGVPCEVKTLAIPEPTRIVDELFVHFTPLPPMAPVPPQPSARSWAKTVSASRYQQKAFSRSAEDKTAAALKYLELIQRYLRKGHG